jgi:hypothetical protein
MTRYLLAVSSLARRPSPQPRSTTRVEEGSFEMEAMMWSSGLEGQAAAWETKPE